MALIPAERQSRILDLVSQRPAVGIAELTRLLRVSHMTVRRDIRALEEAGRVIAVAGGVRLADPTVSREAPHAAKAALNRTSKAAIGGAAARLVPQGAAIYLDAGTTILALEGRLAQRDDLTIVTNDFAVMELLSSHGGSVLHHTGGLVDRENRSAIGEGAARAIRSFRFDIAFISSSSFSEAGLSVTDPGKGAVKEAAVASAASSILLADSSKFGRRAPYASVPMQAFDTLVTDADFLPECVETIEGLGLTVIRGRGETA